jgi:hypothetical protein
VTALGQLELALGSRGHFGGIENEQLFAHLITDPQFRLIGREGRTVCSVGDWRISSEEAMQNFGRRDLALASSGHKSRWRLYVHVDQLPRAGQTARSQYCQKQDQPDLALEAHFLGGPCAPAL